MPDDRRMCRIGELAAAADVTVETLRYYEREGLLPPASRTAGGFREYIPEMGERLRFIKQAQHFGMSLQEIRELVQPKNGRCSAVRDVLATRLADVDRRLVELSDFRRTLSIALERCEHTLARSKNAACPVVRRIGTEKQLGR